MNLTTLRTSPGSYAERAHTLRAACGYASARRARSGSKPFIDFQVHGSELASLVAELRPQHRPTRVRDGLRHPRSLELRRADIAYNDQCVLPRNPRGDDVDVMLARVGDLCVDSLHSTLLSRSLCRSQGARIAAIVFWCRDRETTATDGQIAKAEVDADHAGAGICVRSNLARHSEVPAPAGVLNERSNFGDTGNLARQPEPISLAPINNRITIKSESLAPKWYPAQAFLCRAPVRTATDLVATLREYATDLADGVGQNPEFMGGSYRQCGEVKVARPSPAPTLGVALRLAEIVPNEINRSRVRLQAAPRRAVFDPKLVGEEHVRNLAKQRIRSKARSALSRIPAPDPRP